MTNSRTFFHDRLVLLLLTLNSFLLVLIVATILLRLGDTSEGYIVQYRSNLGLDAFKVGGIKDILSFIPFAAVVFAFQLVIGMRMYHVRSRITHIILLLTSLTLILTLIVSYALLGLR